MGWFHQLRSRLYANRRDQNSAVRVFVRWQLERRWTKSCQRWIGGDLQRPAVLRTVKKPLETLMKLTETAVCTTAAIGDDSAPIRNRKELRVQRTQNVVKGLDGLDGQYSTILIDPPWRFANRTGKIAPEHKRLRRYETMSMEEIADMPVAAHAAPKSHLYMWCPNALLAEGLHIMKAWGFNYKTNIVWYKIRKDGGPDGRGVGFYFRNVTELVLFGVKGSMRTLKPGRTQVNVLSTRKQEHSRKPDELYDIIEACSPGPYLELFARQKVEGWTTWGNEVETYADTRKLYKAYNGHAINGHKVTT